jgi:hypothetical protein
MSPGAVSRRAGPKEGPGPGRPGEPSASGARSLSKVSPGNDLKGLQCLTIPNRAFDMERVFRRMSNEKPAPRAGLNLACHRRRLIML